jgi:hypothetical protein
MLISSHSYHDQSTLWKLEGVTICVSFVIFMFGRCRNAMKIKVSQLPNDNP